MGYSSGITNSLFKKTESGKSIFYPYGKLGSGYILSPDQEREARQFLNRTCMIYFVLILVAILFLGVVSIPLLPIGLVFYQLQLRRLVSSAEKTQEKMSISESYKNMAASMGKPTCMVLFALSLIMTILSVVGFIFRSKLIGSIGIVLFGFLTWYWIMMVRYFCLFLTPISGSRWNSLEKPQSRRVFGLGLEEIVRATAKVYGKRVEELGKKRRGYENEARAMAMYLCRSLGGYKLTEIGRVLGLAEIGVKQK